MNLEKWNVRKRVFKLSYTRRLSVRW